MIQLTKKEILIRDIEPNETDIAVKIFKKESFELVDLFWNSNVSLTFISHFEWICTSIVCCLIGYFTESITYIMFTVISCYIIRYFQILRCYMTYCSDTVKTEMTDIINSFVNEDGCCFKVAVFDGEVIGTVAVRKYASNPKGRTAELLRMYVTKKYQRRGVGSRLLDVARDYCVTYGYENLVLKTTVGNVKSTNFYVRYGFNELQKIMESGVVTAIYWMSLKKEDKQNI
ncbi:N-acetylaspartate synthetase-like [Anneissia japonica]|uniref:N-acetylaspartate synthetase-like n=1 Tax=Anneissia japonica TaxID=1529436 RepID=UPI0014259880|nr:N-acetylaspartate synthetase-like [Anneissia japonica]